VASSPTASSPAGRDPDAAQPGTQACPSLEAIAEYLDADPEDADLEIAAHLRGCASCRDVVGVADVTAAPAGAEGPELEPPPPETPGRYVLLRILGRGGQALVWAAHDHALDREIAFKELREDDARTVSPDARRRFLWSARVAARLAHPSILPVHDLGVRENGAPFHTMPIVEGETLREAVDAGRELGQRLALLPHILDVCNAVAFAHEHDILHRDINPANVMVGRFGETALIDWGLAVELESQRQGTGGGARTERVVGTPAFLSPEQARGEASDVRTDVWGIGGLLYFVVTGQPLYPTQSLERLLARARRGEHEAVVVASPDAPPELAAVIEQALALDPAQRYAGVDLLANDLGACIRGQKVSAYRYTWLRRARRFVAQHRPLVAATAVTLVVSLTAAAVTSWAYQRERSANRAWQAAAHEAEVAELVARQQRDESALHLALAHEAAAKRLASDGLVLESALHALAALDVVASVDSDAARRARLQTQAIAATERAKVRPLRAVTWRRDPEGEQAFVSDLVRLSPDAGLLAVASPEGAIEFWSWHDGHRESRFERSAEPALDLAWVDDERLAVAGKEAIELRGRDGALLQRWPVPQADERRVFYRAGAGELLAVDPRGVLAVQLASPEVREIPLEHRLLRHAAQLPDGDALVLATTQQRLLVWDANSREIVRTIELPRTAEILSASPNGELAIAAAGGWLYRVDLHTGEVRKFPRSYADGIAAVTWLGDDMALALTRHGIADVFNAANGAPLFRTRQTLGIHAVLLATDEHLLMATSDVLTRWSLDLDWRGPVEFAVSDALTTSALTSVACGPQDERVLVGTRGVLHVLHPRPGSAGADGSEEVYELGDAPVESVERSLAGDLVAAVGRTVWVRTAAGEVRRHLLAGNARSVRFSADGTRYAAIAYPDTLVVWSTQNGHELARIRHDSAISTLALSPAGRLVAAGGADRHVELHDLERGELRDRFGPRANWSKLEFLDSETLLAAGGVGVVRVQIGAEAEVLHPVSDYYVRLSASADRRLVVADGLAQAVLLDLESGRSFALEGALGYCLLANGDLLVADENFDLRRRSTDYAIQPFDAAEARRELEASLWASIGEFELERSFR
jgi:WD40 repeat protein